MFRVALLTPSQLILPEPLRNVVFGLLILRVSKNLRRRIEFYQHSGACLRIVYYRKGCEIGNARCLLDIVGDDDDGFS